VGKKIGKNTKTNRLPVVPATVAAEEMGLTLRPHADLCLLRVRRRPNGPEPAREWDGLPPSSLRLLPSFFFPLV